MVPELNAALTVLFPSARTCVAALVRRRVEPFTQLSSSCVCIVALVFAHRHACWFCSSFFIYLFFFFMINPSVIPSPLALLLHFAHSFQAFTNGCIIRPVWAYFQAAAVLSKVRKKIISHGGGRKKREKRKPRRPGVAFVAVRRQKPFRESGGSLPLRPLWLVNVWMQRMSSGSGDPPPSPLPRSVQPRVFLLAVTFSSAFAPFLGLPGEEGCHQSPALEG